MDLVQECLGLVRAEDLPISHLTAMGSHKLFSYFSVLAQTFARKYILRNWPSQNSRGSYSGDNTIPAFVCQKRSFLTLLSGSVIPRGNSNRHFSWVRTVPKEHSHREQIEMLRLWIWSRPRNKNEGNMNFNNWRCFTWIGISWFQSLLQWSSGHLMYSP